MSENPYASPASDPVVELVFDGTFVPAERGERFGAAFLDVLIAAAFGFPISWLFSYLHQRFGIGETSQMTAWYADANYSFGWAAVEGLLAFAWFTGVHWVFLARTGQTIGKKALNIRIVTMDGKKPSMFDLLLKRYGFMDILPLIPVIGLFLPLLDILLIFGKDRRCLHDYVASTRVVKCRPGEVIP